VASANVHKITGDPVTVITGANVAASVTKSIVELDIGGIAPTSPIFTASKNIKNLFIIVAYAVAIQRHLDEVAFQINPISSLAVPTVATGSDVVDDSKDVPQVIDLVAVPMMDIHSS